MSDTAPDIAPAPTKESDVAAADTAAVDTAATPASASIAREPEAVAPAAPEAAPLAPTDPAPANAASKTASPPTPAAPGIGVLLVNLGTPDAATPDAVRRYLKEFLTDPRVIEKDTLFWKLLLNCLILPIRSRRKARDYRKIWNCEKDESPFKTITRSQAEKLGTILEPLGKHVIVDWAMRYASPSIASRLEALAAQGCDRILVIPLYPQYWAATTGTVCDEVFRFLMGLRRQPAVRILPAYYD